MTSLFHFTEEGKQQVIFTRDITNQHIKLFNNNEAVIIEYDHAGDSVMFATFKTTNNTNHLILTNDVEFKKNNELYTIDFIFRGAISISKEAKEEVINLSTFTLESDIIQDQIKKIK